MSRDDIATRQWSGLWKRTGAGVAALAVLGLAGCGSAGAPKAGSPSTAAQSKAASSKALTPITMVEAVDAPAYAPVTVAEQAGIFEKNGLKVNVVPLQAGSTAAATLIGGSAQFDAGVASDALLADSKGNHLIAIAALTNAIELDVEVNKSWADAHHFDPKAPLADRLKALKGAKIGITAPGSITDLATRYMFSTVGYQSGVDYHEVALGSPSSNLAALQAGTIEATIFDPSFAEVATSKGIGVLGWTGLDFPVLAHAAFGAVITTEAYAQAHPDITRAVATSIAEANDLIDQNPKVAMPIIERYYHSIPASILEVSMPQYHFSPGGRTTAEDWSNMAAIFVQNHQLTPEEAKAAVHEFTNQYLPSGATPSSAGG